MCQGHEQYKKETASSCLATQIPRPLQQHISTINDFLAVTYIQNSMDPQYSVITMPKIGLTQEASIGYRTIMTDFFKGINFTTEASYPTHRSDVEVGILEQTEEWARKGLSSNRWLPYMEASLNIATMAYGHTRLDVQVHIALFNLLMMAIDDFKVGDEDLDLFTVRLLSGSPQPDPLLECVVDNLRHMPDFFPISSSRCITISTMEFIDGTIQDKKLMGMRLQVLPYVNYRRFRNGLGAGYGFFIWDKFSFPDVSNFIQIMPEAVIYIDFTNDILSFFKEQVAGETDNYIHSRASVSNKDVSDVLRDLVSETVSAVNGVRSTLTEEKEKAAWGKFVKGYAAYHYMSPRYKLRELLCENAILC